jgi:pilus assembly protein Flp/PilA
MGWPARTRLARTPHRGARRAAQPAQTFGKRAVPAQRTPRGTCRGTAVATWPRRDRRRAAIGQQHAATPHMMHGHDAGAQSSGEDQMLNLINIVKSFSNQEDGQDLLEYALLVALIALIAIGAVGMAGGAVNDIFTEIANQLSAAA